MAFVGFFSFYLGWMIFAVENPFLYQDILDQTHLELVWE
jgi:hypothetical protein